MHINIDLIILVLIGYIINEVAPKVSSVSSLVKNKRGVPPEYANSTSPLCESFTTGEESKQTLYSPGYPNNYPNNTDCFVILKAPPGYLLQLDFRNYFNIEHSDGCKFDYLEVRDGAHGFSNLKGQFCGQEFPPLITSTDRHLWLHFRSDENIEYSGFIAVYEYIPRPTKLDPEEETCQMNVTGFEGYINRTDISQSRIEQSILRNVSIDCMWLVKVQEGWNIQLSFDIFKLHKPNDCEMNFVDVFPEKTDLPSRIKNFCGSMADSISSKTNTLHIRFFANPLAINSTFSILFTALRDKKVKGENCEEGEYDCEDETCISENLKCNGKVNCRFRWDEDEEVCKSKVAGQSEHVLIIIIVFGLILGGMLTAFIINCLRKLIRDHKIIREHIRQSKESKLDELGRHSTKISRENLAIKINPRNKDSPNVLDEISQRYYREQIAMQMQPLSSRVDIKRENNTRNQEIKDILETRQNSEEDHDDMKSSMCDMACQTRESLFQPVFKNKVAQSPTQPPRFSTFGYDTNQQQQQPQQQQQGGKTSKHTANRNKKTVATTIEMEDGGNNQESTPIKKHGKIEESRLVLDIRNSAPDVIIMTSSH